MALGFSTPSLLLGMFSQTLLAISILLEPHGLCQAGIDELMTLSNLGRSSEGRSALENEHSLATCLSPFVLGTLVLVVHR